MPVVAKDSLEIKYLELHEIYKDTNKADVLAKAEACMISGDSNGAKVLLDSLPDRNALIENLSTHLNGKPVERTFRRVLAGEAKNRFELLKGLFSLGCHICIELENGNMEYSVLLDDVMANIYKVRNGQK